MLAFESLADFEAYINLTQQQLTNTFVKSIQNHARTKFYAKGDPNCVYVRFELASRIQTDFAGELTLQDTAIGPLGLLTQSGAVPIWNWVRQLARIRSTQFTRLDGAREFHWITRVDVVRLFESEPSAGLVAPFRKLLLVGFDVKWKANVKADGRFHDIEVSTIEKKDVQVREGTDDNMKEWHLG